MVEKGIIAWAEARVPSWRSEESESWEGEEPFPPDWLNARSNSRSSVECKFKAWMEAGDGEQPSDEAYEFRGAAAVPAAHPSSGHAGASSAADLSLAGLNLETVSNPNNFTGRDAARVTNTNQAPATNATSLQDRRTTHTSNPPPLHTSRSQSATAPGGRRIVAFEQQQEREETDGRHANVVGAFPGAEGLSFGFDQQPQGLASARRPSITDATRMPEPFAPPTRASEHFASSTRVPEPLQSSTTAPDQWTSSAARRRRRLEAPPRVPEHFTVTTHTPQPRAPARADDVAEVARPRNEGRRRHEPEPSTQVQPMDDEELREWYQWWRRRHAEKQVF